MFVYACIMLRYITESNPKYITMYIYFCIIKYKNHICKKVITKNANLIIILGSIPD